MAIPLQKLGTEFQNPAWRYEALRNPLRFRLKNFVSQTKAGAGHLRRFIHAGIPYVVNYKYPAYLSELLNSLSRVQSHKLLSVWDKAFKARGRAKIVCEGDGVIPWDLTKLDKLPDPFLCRAVQHFAGIEGDPDIGYALSLSLNEDVQEVFSTMGYMIYAGIPDMEIAKRWRISPRKVHAVRMLFFDFSHFPTDKIARWAVLRQLRDSKIITDTDFSYYRRIFDLGELGLKAQVDYNSLTETEKIQVRSFLDSTMVSNTLNMHMTIRTSKDALAYTRVVTDFARLGAQREEVKQRQAQTDLLRMRIRQIESETASTVLGTTPEDAALIKELSLIDATDVPCVSIDDLKKM